MKIKMTPKLRKALIKITAILCSLVVVFGACGLYINDYYRADTLAILEMDNKGNIAEGTRKDGTLVFEPSSIRAGLIFYQGEKIDHNAYVPLMRELAQDGILCVLIKMPLRLAMLNKNAANEIQEAYSEIEDWYMAGHSLGGSTAASYISKHVDEYKGLILLASYSTVDLSNSGLKVMSIYGSEDGVMNRKKYEKCKKNLPENFKQYIINGGNHAFFGMYGTQKGDGEGSYGNERQITYTAGKIDAFIG